MERTSNPINMNRLKAYQHGEPKPSKVRKKTKEEKIERSVTINPARLYRIPITDKGRQGGLHLNSAESRKEKKSLSIKPPV